MKHEEVLKKLRQDPSYVAAEEELRPALELADAVLRLRLAKGWSQAELARRVGTRQANISKLENGLANPTLDFLRRLAQALEAELTIQLGAQPSPEPARVAYVVPQIRTVAPEALWEKKHRLPVASPQRRAGFTLATQGDVPATQYQAA